MLQLKELREARSMTQHDIARLLGVSTQAYSNYELGKRDISNRMLISLCTLLNVSSDEILGISEEEKTDIPKFLSPVSPISSLPVIASVRAGWNGIAEEDFESDEIPVFDTRETEDCCYFRVKGNSMFPQIQENDLALIHRQSTIENGEIAVIITSDDEGTLKKIKKHSDSIELISFNSEYPPRILNEGEFTVFGKLIATLREY